MIELKPLNKDTTPAYVLVFAAGSGLVGFLIVVLDLCGFLTGAKSPFGLSHGWKKTPILATFWPLGAAITGYIGTLLQIFQPTLLACATAGVAWHFGMQQIAKRARRQLEEEADTGDEEIEQ
ncbi:hypothetical protein ACYZX9_14860 [Sphingomonas citri]